MAPAGPTPDAWRHTVEEYFGFLADHGFTMAWQEQTAWTTSVAYAKEVHAVVVTLNGELACVDVELVRLADDGARLPVQIWVTSTQIDTVLLANVVEARTGQRPDRELTGLDERAIGAQLAHWSARLRTVAPDHLDGSDAAILDGERLIRARVEAHPQVVTISLPDHSTDDDVQRAVEEARCVTPPEVDIIVHRYRS